MIDDVTIAETAKQLMGAVVDGIPLMLVIVALVEFAKQFGLAGKACLAVAMGLGALFGIAYKLQFGLPSTFAGWFAAIVFGIAMGLAASGTFELVKKLRPNGTSA